MLISHEKAFELEHIVRRVFNAERGGVMNVAEADVLENRPMNAPIAIFSPLYLKSKEYPDIEEFMDKYCDFYYCEPSEIESSFVDSFIRDLKKLVDKYYPNN